MKPIKDFMRELLDARIAEEKAILANRAPYRKKFFTSDCLWDSRRFTLEMNESERIVNVDDSGPQPTVITEYTASVSPPSARINRRRYQLKTNADSFLICRVESECSLCRGRGDADCIGCKGKHWI